MVDIIKHITQPIPNPIPSLTQSTQPHPTPSPKKMKIMNNYTIMNSKIFLIKNLFLSEGIKYLKGATHS